jgi:integral membrane protein (TIGR01906 family)
MARSPHPRLRTACTALGILILPLALHLLAFSILAQTPRFYDVLPGAEGRSEALDNILSYYRGSYAPEGYTEAELAHLADVRGVFRGAFLLTPILLLLLWPLLRYGRARVILRYGGGLAVVLPLLAAVLPFGPVFAAFHGLFFEAGTWIFPVDSRLIQLFPVEFFQRAGALITLLGAVFGLALAGLTFLKPTKSFK